jgi:hypothetical protein
MKILHVGGLETVSSLLANEQRQSGHQVDRLGPGASTSMLQAPLTYNDWLAKVGEIAQEQYQIIIFHLAQSFCDPSQPGLEKTVEGLRKLKASGAKLCLFVYGTDALADLSAREILVQTIISEYLDHVFIGTIDNFALSRFSSSWSFLPVPFCLEEIPAPPPREPQAQRVRILYLPYSSSGEEIARVNEIVASLRAGELKFDFTAAPLINELSSAKFDSMLGQADLVIEHISRPTAGILGLRAMLHGKTLLSGSSAEARKLWEPLSLSPILDTSLDNLGKRLSSIVREPRCLRDLGQRSRQYIERYHNSRIVGQLAMTIFLKLTQRA